MGVSTSLSAMAMRGVFLVLFVTFGTWAQETPIDNGEAVDESLKGLLVNNSLAEENSYRCGVFYAGDEPGDVPRFTVFVLPKRFEMDCAKDPEEQKAEAKKECTELVIQDFLMGWKLDFIIMFAPTNHG